MGLVAPPVSVGESSASVGDPLSEGLLSESSVVVGSAPLLVSVADALVEGAALELSLPPLASTATQIWLATASASVVMKCQLRLISVKMAPNVCTVGHHGRRWGDELLMSSPLHRSASGRETWHRAAPPETSSM